MNLGLLAQMIAMGLIQVLMAFLAVAGLWAAIDKFTHFDDYKEIVERQNWNYLIQRLGLASAHVTAILACYNLSGAWSSLWNMLLGLLWVTLMMGLLYLLIERLLGRRTRQQEAHMDGLGVSIAKAAAYMTVGLVFSGSLSGTAPNGTTAIAATVAFTLLGLMTIPVGVWLHNRGLKHNLTEETRNGELASAAEMAGVLLMLGILLRNAIMGDFVGWIAGLIGFGITLGVGWLMLYIYRPVARKLIARHCVVTNKERKEAVGAAVLLAAFLPLTALLVSGVTPLVVAAIAAA